MRVGRLAMAVCRRWPAENGLAGLPGRRRHAGCEQVPGHRDHHVLGRSRPRTFPREVREYEVIVHIATGVVEGRFPKRALRHVMEWYDLHQDELLANWERCRRKEAPNPIEPLE